MRESAKDLKGKPASSFELLMSYIDSLGLTHEQVISLKTRIEKQVHRVREISLAKGAIKEILLIETITGLMTFDKKKAFYRTEKSRLRDRIVTNSFPKSQSLDYEKQDYENIDKKVS